MTSHQIINSCIQSTHANIERVKKTFSSLSEIQLNWKTNSESWSLGECLSHLINSNNLYFIKFESILEFRQTSEEKDFPYKQSFGGKFITKGVDPRNVRKSKTFKEFFPDSSDIRKSIIDDCVKSSLKFIELTGRMRNLDLKKIKLSSPINKLIRMNLGDPLIFIPLHDERHLNQAERVMNHAEFPKV